MRASIPAMTALALAAAWPAGAAEFIPGWDLDTIWSSNVYRTTDEDALGRTIPKEDDFSIRTGPDLRLRDPQGDLTYDLNYRLRYEEFIRLNGISEFDHFASARADWSATDRTSFTIANDFADTASLNGLFTFVGPTADAIVRADRQRILTNTLSSSSRHRLGKLWELTLSGDHTIYDYESEGTQDSTSFSGTLQLTRGITPRLVMGMGGSFQRQEYDAGDVAGEGSGTNFFQGFGVANYQMSRTLRLTVSAGPALSVPDEIDPADANVFSLQPFNIDTCPLLDGQRVIPLAQAERFQIQSGDRCSVLAVGVGGATFLPVLNTAEGGARIAIPNLGDTGVENTLTYFARVRIEKSWRLYRASLSYSRSANSGSGLGTSTIIDSLFAQLIYTPTRYWTFTLQGVGSLQSAVSSANEQLVVVEPQDRAILLGQVDPNTLRPIAGGARINAVVTVPNPVALQSGERIDNPIDIRTYRVELLAERRITANLTANASASWYEQTNSGQLQENKRTEFRVLMGATWTFDAIPL